MPPTATFTALLAERLRLDPGRPSVTFYDDATGERVELSMTTYANWVAKTASLAQDELGLTRGDRVRIDLPTHWCGVVWLGAAWSLGLGVTTGEADLVVCGPETLAGIEEGTASVVAISLRPLGGRFVDRLPPGVVDYGEVVFGQPDSFVAYDPPAANDLAWSDDVGALTQAELVDLPALPGRLLTDANPCSRPGLPLLVGPLRAGAGTVWVRNADDRGWERRADAEMATIHRMFAG